MSVNDIDPESRPDNMTFIQIPLRKTPGETNELSFVLRPSPISGVGVFLTHPVKKGTYLALFVDDTVRRIPTTELEKDPQLKAFCLVYGIERRGYVCVPHNFSHMEVGWFMNHSTTSNAVHDGKWIASRDISAGEEITIDYGDNF
ncbi:MAG: SET domain-containing protein [Pirellulaceae bacterium]